MLLYESEWELPSSYHTNDNDSIMKGACPMASTSSSTNDAAKRTKMISVILGITYSIVINAVFPYIIYTLLKSYTNLSDFWALVLSGVPPMIDAIVGIIRKGRVDLIAG